MPIRITLLIAALASFASFGWGMLRHFERRGKPKPGMLLTVIVVPVFAAIHIKGLLSKPLAIPLMAIFLYLAGVALFWFAVAATRGRGLAACFQGQVPGQVVHAGPYRVIRHPFYASYLLAWIAGFAATGWWPLALIAIAMAGMYAYAARQEERCILSSPLREEYRDYMRRTGRFLPGKGAA
jgi:protein-S-isoprenylcysteine O-methyltransferase Ste14